MYIVFVSVFIFDTGTYYISCHIVSIFSQVLHYNLLIDVKVTNCTGESQAMLLVRAS